MKAYALTEKGKALIEEKIINGERHILMDRINGREAWIPISAFAIVQPKCSRCGYEGLALEEHHIHGRKHSKETITLCANCHRELHAQEGYK